MRRISQFIGVIIITLVLGTGFQVAAQTAGSSAAAFKTGQSVATTDTVNVRAGGALDGIVLGTQAAGAKGEVMSEAPVVSGGYTWYRINFQSGVDGWVVSQYLRSVAVPVGIEIAAFYASPNKVTTNGSSTIYWDVNGADTCVLTSQVGSAAAKTLRTNANVKGMEVVKNLQTTTKYKLACTKGTTSKVEKTVTVTVSNTPASTSTSTSTPPRGSGTETFTSGQSVMTLDSVEVKQSPATSSRTLGTQPKSKKGVVSPEVAKEADGYRWYRVNFDGGVDGWVPAVFLSSVGLGVGAQINSFIAVPATIKNGQTTTLSWDAVGVDTCTLYKNYGTESENVIRENADLYGSYIAKNVDKTSKFTLKCNKGSAKVEQTLTVTVTSTPTSTGKPVCDMYQANPATITKGKATTLTWQTTNANKVTITRPGGTIEEVKVDGSLSVQPDATHAFVLTATGPNGTTTCKTTVTVVEPIVVTAQITSFVARPALIISGSSTKLQWTSRGTDYCYIKDASQKTIASDQKSDGSFTVTPLLKDGTDPKFTYTLVCHDASTQKDVFVEAKTTVVLRQPISTGLVRGASITVNEKNSVLADLQNQLSELLAKVSQLEKKEGDFAIGDPVVTTDVLKVRARGAGGVLGVQPAGATGVVTSAWVNAGGRGWYQVDFTTGVDGWVAASYLESGVVLDKVAITFSRHQDTPAASTIVATEGTSENLSPLSYLVSATSEMGETNVALEKLAVSFTITNAQFLDVIESTSLSINGSDYSDVSYTMNGSVTTAVFDITEPVVVENQNEVMVEVRVVLKDTITDLSENFTIKASVTAADRDATDVLLENATATFSGTAVGEVHTIVVTE